MAGRLRVDSLQIHLWAFPIDPTDFAGMEVRPLLSPDEMNHANRFRFPSLANTFVVCRGLVRLLLGRYLERDPHSIHCEHQIKGKPIVRNLRHLNFNASHTDGMMMCAITESCEIGVDIERFRDISDMQELATRFFSYEEARELLLLPQNQRRSAFYRCWTGKEAYIKAVGVGLSASLHSFCVTLRPTDAPRFIHIQGSQELVQYWQLSEVKWEGPYIAALAYPGPRRTIQMHGNIDPLSFLNS